MREILQRHILAKEPNTQGVRSPQPDYSEPLGADSSQSMSVPAFVGAINPGSVQAETDPSPSTVVDDVTALRKRIKLQELLVFETTLVMQRPLPAFSHAIDHAKRQIAEDQDQSFERVVDIKRARMQRIKPLASVEYRASAESRSSLPYAERDIPYLATMQGIRDLLRGKEHLSSQTAELWKGDGDQHRRRAGGSGLSDRAHRGCGGSAVDGCRV